MGRIWFNIRKYQHILFFLLIFIIYNLTTAPSVVEIDSGELATIQLLPGVAHPTGYPIFTLLGYVVSKIIPITQKILLLNKLAMLYVFLSLIVFYQTSILLLKHTNISKEISSPFAILSTLLLAFSVTFWKQSVSVEVYSLHLFLLLYTIKRLIIAYENGTKRNWIYFAIALAFAFGNHMTTVMILPAVAFLYFKQNGFTKNSFTLILLMLGVFIPLFIAEYSILILLAHTHPKLNWGDVENVQNLFAHLTGRQYRVWMFSGLAVAKKQLAYFLINLFTEFAYVGLLSVFVGIFALKNLCKDYLIFFSVLALSVIFYAINYDIHDIDSYFLFAYVSFAFFSLFGFLSIYDFLKKQFDKKIIILILLTFPFVELVVSFGSVSQAKNFVFEDYTKEALNLLDKNSLVLTYQWDYFVSPSYYFRYIENFRSDVAVVDKELLRRSWYYKQLGSNYPFVFNGLQKTVNDFLIALKPFETGGKFNSALLEKLYRKIISGIIANNVKVRSVYIGPELVDNELKRGEFVLPQGYELIPEGLFYKVVPKSKYYDLPFKNFSIRFENAPQNRYVKQIEQFVKTMLVRRAFYEMAYNRNEKAKEIVKIYLKKFPGSRLPAMLERLIK